MPDEETPTGATALEESVAPGYQFEGPALELGGLMAGIDQLTGTRIRVPLAMPTGTG